MKDIKMKDIKILRSVLMFVFGVWVIIWVIMKIFIYPQYTNQFNLIAIIFTFAVLIWYAYDTHRIANETVAQTELTTMPIMSLYIRNIDWIADETKRHKIKQYAITHLEGNGIIPSPYYIALRNMGNGPAFNVEVESENFKAEKYQTRFFAPNGDEYAVKIIKKPDDKIRDVNELKGVVFIIKCRSFLGKGYEYKYKIYDVEEKIVEFGK